jgi:hypothetical protein
MNSLSWEGLKAKRDWTLQQRHTAGRDTLLSLTPASHCFKGYVTEPYSSVTLLQGLRYRALHQRHTAARVTLQSLTPASYCCKGYVTEPNTSVTLLQGLRYRALHQRHIAARDTIPSLTPALHCCKGYVTESYTSVRLLQGIRYWALHKRHTAPSDTLLSHTPALHHWGTLLSLTPALHRWKWHVAEPYTSFTSLEGTRCWALHQRYIAGSDTLLSLTPALHRWKGYVTDPYTSVTPVNCQAHPIFPNINLLIGIWRAGFKSRTGKRISWQFSWLSPALAGKCRGCAEVRSRTLPSTRSLIHYGLTTLPSDATAWVTKVAKKKKSIIKQPHTKKFKHWSGWK